MAQTFPQVGIRHEIGERRERQRKTWSAHDDTRRFMRDWIVPDDPDLGVALADCRMAYQPWKSKTTDDKYKVTPHACWKVPWCIPCTQAKVRARVRKAEDAFHRFTPPGEKVRTIHAVFTAPLTEDGEGWGAKAKEDIGRFVRVVVRTLQDFFGRGIGGWASYQDFGEKPFTKSHPHVDLTLNGWMIEDGKVVPVPSWDFRTGDRERLSEAYDTRVLAFGLNARSGNSRIDKLAVGLRAARGAMAYQLRELVDLRKVRYDKDRSRVGWASYRDPSIDWMPAADFRDWYEAYEDRVQPHRANRVHRRFGFMSRMRSRMRVKLGFADEPIQHDEGCPCSACGDWEKVVDAVTSYPSIRPSLELNVS